MRTSSTPSARRSAAETGRWLGLRGDDLAAQVLNALVERTGLDPAAVEDVQMGCVTQIGEQGWNIGRMAVLAAGWPVEVSGTTVDRQCGSSMQTNFNAAAAVAAGQLDVVVSAGRGDDVAGADGLERRRPLEPRHRSL